MHNKKQSPSWWLLYLSLPMMIGLFLIEMRLPLSDTGHRLAEMVIVLVVCGYMWGWLNANIVALLQDDTERRRAALRTESSPAPPRSVTIVPIHGSLKRQPRRVQESVFTWLALITSSLFHRRKTSDVKQIRP